MAKDVLKEGPAGYIPPKGEWTPVDDALYGVEDIYNVEPKKAKRLREDAIRYSFKHHYEGNKFYHEYCKKRDVKPDDIKTEGDLNKIPLIPGTFFKGYPDIKEDGGKEFIHWLEKIYTGKFPKTEIKRKKPSYDDIIEELTKKNIYLTVSSGRTGKFSIIPRDRLTYFRSQYSSLSGFRTYLFNIKAEDVCIFTTLPDPSESNYVGSKIWEPIISLNSSTIFREDHGGRIYRKKLFSSHIKSLSRGEKEKKKLILLSTPSILDPFMDYMEKRRMKFNFDGFAAFYGGWINDKGEKIYSEGLEKRINENFGIPQENCRDWFIMNELNGHGVECEGGYKHLPYFIHPMVLDEEMNFLPCGEWGRLAFIDPLANSYPGFIMTEDRVKILENCPECDRKGKVLDPEISKVRKEIKGCAAILGRALERGGR